MFLGTAASIIPATLIVIGDYVNIFIYQQNTQDLAFLSNGSTVQCDAVVDLSYLGQSISNLTNIDCSYIITNASTISTIIKECYSSKEKCISNDDFISDVNTLVYIVIAIGVILFIFSTFQIYFFQVACERQIKRIRLAFYQAILRQEIGWFDVHTKEELSSSIS